MAEEKLPPEQQDPKEELQKVLDAFKTDATKLLDEIKQQKSDAEAAKNAITADKDELAKKKEEANIHADAIQNFHTSVYGEREGGRPLAVEVPVAAKQVLESRIKVSGIEKRAEELSTQLFGGKDKEGKEVRGLRTEMEERAQQLHDLHSKMFDKPAEGQSSVAQAVTDFLVEFTQKKGELENIRKEIIGYQDALLGALQEDGQRKDGVKGRVDGYVKDLSELLAKHTKEQGDLLKKVNDLLEGASTAALAKAFSAHKASFDKVNENWMKVFVGAIAIIMLVPLLTFVLPDSDAPTWVENLLVRLPIVGGAITLAWYASKQRSQNKRLQQEYGYKEDVAMIYVALKKEIEALGDHPLGTSLKEQVLSVLVKAVEHNPSDTLDSKAHDDKGPLHDAFKKGMEAAKDIAKEVVPKVVNPGK